MRLTLLTKDPNFDFFFGGGDGDASAVGVGVGWATVDETKAGLPAGFHQRDATAAAATRAITAIIASTTYRRRFIFLAASGSNETFTRSNSGRFDWAAASWFASSAPTLCSLLVAACT